MENKPDKGLKNGSCNVTACQKPNAIYFNKSTKAYYCAECAKEINWPGGRADCMRLYGTPLLCEPDQNLLVDNLEAACASMLQRWATIHNLFQAEGDLKTDAILAVAKLSAEEFVVNGLEFGGDRLIRQENAARVLLLVKTHLDQGPILKGSAMHSKIYRAAAMLSSYPDRLNLSTETGDKPVDC